MATTGPYNARLMLFYLDGTAIAYSTNVSISGNMSSIDVTSKDSGGDKDIIAGLRDWTANCDFIHAIDSSSNLSAIYTAWAAGTQINVKVSTNTSADKYYHGSAYITSWNADFPNEDKATGSFTVEGDGALSESTLT